MIQTTPHFTELYPTFVRLEYLTPDGWTTGHSGLGLIDPQRYVDRLASKGKFGRCLELDKSTMQPTGVEWAPASLPDPATLVPTATAIPAVPCDLCQSTTHQVPAECLL